TLSYHYVGLLKFAGALPTLSWIMDRAHRDESAWRGFLSLRDPAGAAHAAGPPAPHRPSVDAPGTPADGTTVSPISANDPAAASGTATVARAPVADRPRLLISTVGVGAGHNTAARAVAQEVQENWSEAEVRVVDLLDLMPRACRATMLMGHVQGMT